MAKEVKTVKIKNSDGKELEVTEKAFEVVYKNLGFKLVDGKKKKEDK